MGIPRPLSATRTRLSGKSAISISFANPPIASSRELSKTSQTRWWSPAELVVPMYMPGRRRTASNPSSTVIELASYEEPHDFGVVLLADLLFFSAIFNGFIVSENTPVYQWKTHGLTLVPVHLGVSPPSGRLFGYRGSQPRFLTFL